MEEIIITELKQKIEDVFEVEEEQIGIHSINFYGQFKKDVEVAFHILKKRLTYYNYLPFIEKDEYNDRILIRIIRHKEEEEQENYTLHIVLLIATILTTLIAGALHYGINPITHFNKLYLAFPFVISLLGILGIHELGHYTFAKLHKVKATLPYFIPAPSILGTFGAVIRIKSPFPNKKVLLEIGAAGPIAGFIVAIIVCIIGLKLSKVVSIAEFQQRGGGIILGNSLLFLLLSKIIMGNLKEGLDVMLHPVAFAGWIGLLVTGINLLPAGQLDGGHITYSLFSKYHSIVARVLTAGLVVIGILFWPGWFIWAALIIIIGYRHPPPLDNVTEIDRSGKIIGIIALIILILTFIPNPMRVW